jgi:dienelactone hydrolase
MCDLDGCGRHRAMPPIVVSDGDRRAFLKGLVSLPLAAVLFDPLLARAQADTLQLVKLEIEGADPVQGALALPDGEVGPAVLLIHEWWGLNDQIKAVAAELAKLGFVAFAIDLFDSEPATEPDAAMALVEKTAAGLEPRYGPVLGHFATEDKFITRDMVERFKRAMAEDDKSQFLTVYWYEADHAFANPSGARYDASDAKLAWDRTVEFLRAALA